MTHLEQRGAGESVDVVFFENGVNVVYALQLVEEPWVNFGQIMDPVHRESFFECTSDCIDPLQTASRSSKQRVRKKKHEAGQGSQRRFTFAPE